MDFYKFKELETAAAELFERICFADDAFLIERCVIEAPRASLHHPGLWLFEPFGEGWKASGDWGEVWEWRDKTWFCVQERPWSRAL